MILTCLGPNNVLPSDETMGAIAQASVFEDFCKYFMSICPGGIVIQELDYLGQATSVFAKPLGMGVQNPFINAILQILQDDYKREKRFSFRKNDALGICPSGRLQLLEVTTVPRVAAGNQQILEKTVLLNSLGKQLSLTLATKPIKVPMPQVDAGPSPWTPPRGSIKEVTRTTDQVTYICFEPTNDPARVPNRLPGVILYEVHRLKLERAPQNMPALDRQKLLDAIKALPPNLTPEEAKKYGERHVKDNPGLVRWLQGLSVDLVVAVGIILAIVLAAAFLWELAAILAFVAAFVTAAEAKIQ